MTWIKIKSAIPDVLYRRLTVNPFAVTDVMKFDKYTSFAKIDDPSLPKQHGDYLVTIHRKTLEENCDRLVELFYDFDWLAKNDLIQYVSKLTKEQYIRRAKFELKKKKIELSKDNILEFINNEIEDLYGNEHEIVAINLRPIHSRDFLSKGMEP